LDTSFRRLAWLVAVLALVSACDAYGPKPTPVETLTPRPTVLPEATVGTPTTFESAPLGLSLMIPSTWKPAISADSVVISASGTTDTSFTAGPFLYIIPDAGKVLPNRMSFTFRSDITDPAQQLDLLMAAITRDDPRFSPARKYDGTQYPAAISTGYERDNQLVVILMYVGDNHWTYVGAQSLERYFSYYDSTVFKPALSSLKVK
jgi:hypothetical protein